MANSKSKYISENSIVIILKFSSSLQRDKVVQDKTFHKHKGRLESIAVLNGGVSEYFTH